MVLTPLQVPVIDLDWATAVSTVITGSIAVQAELVALMRHLFLPAIHHLTTMATRSQACWTN